MFPRVLDIFFFYYIQKGERETTFIQRLVDIGMVDDSNNDDSVVDGKHLDTDLFRTVTRWLNKVQ